LLLAHKDGRIGVGKLAAGALKPLRILHVVASYLPATRYGGPIVSVHGLARSQAALGHDVHVLTTSVDGAQNSNVALEVPVLLDGVKVHYFQSTYLRRLYFSWRMMQWLQAHILQFDVLHLHAVFLFPMTMAARIAKRAGVPYVIAPRGMLVPELIAQRSGWLKRAWIALFDRHTLAYAGAFHATSTLEIDDAKRLSLPVQNAIVLANGVDAPNASLQRPYQEAYILYLGRLSAKKRIDWLIQALAKVPDVHLIVAGVDEDSTRAQLEAEVSRRALQARVQLVGELDAERKWAWLQHAEALALVSVNENFGNSAAEAISVGCPVIVTPGVGLAKDVLEHSLGWVVHSIDALSAAICAATADATARAEKSANAFQFAQAHLQWRAIAQNSVSLYRELLSQRIPSAPSDCH
jgi:glycosyltransferase involved in cell wall biosynthesis